MKLTDVLTPNIETIAPDQMVQEAAQKMLSADIGALPVVQNGTPLGIVTDRDITIRAVAEGRNPSQTAIADIMTRGVHTVTENQDVAEVAREMKDAQIRRVIVLRPDKTIAGIVALADLATHDHPQSISGEVLEDVSKK